MGPRSTGVQLLVWEWNSRKVFFTLKNSMLRAGFESAILLFKRPEIVHFLRRRAASHYILPHRMNNFVRKNFCDIAQIVCL